MTMNIQLPPASPRRSRPPRSRRKRYSNGVWRVGTSVLKICWRWIGAIGHGMWYVRGWLWQTGWYLVSICVHHFLAPLLCFVCIYLGVLSTLPLPTALWIGLLPSITSSVPTPPLTDFPLAEIPTAADLPAAFIASIPLALAVFRHHYREWQISSDPLLACMFYAAYAGVSWPWSWFRHVFPKRPC